jgi:hypothetical protein
MAPDLVFILIAIRLTTKIRVKGEVNIFYKNISHPKGNNKIFCFLKNGCPEFRIERRDETDHLHVIEQKKKKRKLQNEKNILLLKNEKEIRHAIPNAVPPFYAVQRKIGWL